MHIVITIGVNPTEIDNLLAIRILEVAHIEEKNQSRLKFLMTGNMDLPGQMAGVSILQG